MELTGKQSEGVTSLQRTDDGWKVQVEVVEVRRIPDTTDVLAIYELDVDEQGASGGVPPSAPLRPRRPRRELTCPSQRTPSPRGPTPRWPGQSSRPQPANLADILERVLDKGIIIAGDIRVNLLDIELLTIKIRLLIVSVDKAQEMGIDWWRNDPMLNSRAQDLEDENRALRERLHEIEGPSTGPEGQLMSEHGPLPFRGDAGTFLPTAWQDARGI